MSANYVTGSVTATTGGVTLPVENIRPAPGVAGLVTIVNAGPADAILTAPGSGGFVLPAGSPLVALVLGGVKLTAATASSTAAVSYAYATNG